MVIVAVSSDSRSAVSAPGWLSRLRHRRPRCPHEQADQRQHQEQQPDERGNEQHRRRPAVLLVIARANHVRSASAGDVYGAWNPAASSSVSTAGDSMNVTNCLRVGEVLRAP